MSAPSLPQDPALIPFLYLINHLTLRASGSETVEEFIFTAVNDTHHLIAYDRAVLLSFEGKRSRVVGISGESVVNKMAPRVKEWQGLVEGMEDKKVPGNLSAERFSEETQALWEQRQPLAVYWIPIFYQKEQVLGLWLEREESANFSLPTQDFVVLIQDLVAPAYGAAWGRLGLRSTFRGWWKRRQGLAALLVFSLFLIACLPVSLRVAAPCEIVATHPYVVRTPLQGVIKELLVAPGENVLKGQELYHYDREPIEKALKKAEQDLRVRETELERLAVLSLSDERSQRELEIQTLRRDKVQVDLELAQYEASLLTAKAPIEGVVLLQQADEWRGRPVDVGEKVLVISHPQRTKLKLWIPEKDNVDFRVDKPIQVFLNISPTETYQATIQWVANESSVSDQGVPCFEASAHWLGAAEEEEIKLGLHGVAILYGDSVPLIYYLLRKPLGALRYYLSI